MSRKPESDIENIVCNIDHERDGASEEIEFQVKWQNPR